MSLKLVIGEASATGPREENQDALRSVLPEPSLAGSKGCLFALADGVSYCADGRLAAQSSVQALAQDYYATPETWSVTQSLEKLLQAQNRWLQTAGNGQPLLTTLSALVLRGRRFTLAHVGDCRAYRWRDAELRRLSQDHVWQQPGMQHVLTRALGLESHLVADFSEGELNVGDTLLLLSDGVWSTLGDAGVRSLLQATNDPRSAAQALVHAAHCAGSQDNASALLIRVEALPESDWQDQAASWPPAPALKQGQRFEGWQVLALLSESQQSRRYRVADEQGRHWLLKTLPAALAEDGSAAQALMMEEWLQRRVPGRAFVEIHPLPRRRHLYYVQREYAGRSLAEQLEADGPLPLAEWLDCATRLLRAVGQLHRRNILHRDIKPENLHRGVDGELRLLDFGLAYCPGLSRDGAYGLPGTPSYIAPERYHGATPEPRQDLFAVGVTLHRLLTGQFPYGEVEAFQVPRFHSPPVSAARRRPELPAWLDAWLARCLASDPADRFETAEEALLQLEQGERQPPPLARPLLQREPLKTWRAIAGLSLLLNLALILTWLYRH
ncbi:MULTISPECIES: bifunctional protein-serine/threonine kinase/phosphatase [Pseudomonas]|uniref:bifunctional protein-serine/threonine kinase/phosphatase n=1 Tax=Pseudomonas TaxID=286 RepID=UPI00257A3DA2|nr:MULTISPECIES: bifunctional protein-serine/threonine kinase/phosphatase [Pseudomonas]